jgi:hypothetical protein
MPERIQRRRTPGWRLPESAIYVGRPGRWGNPYLLGPIAASFPSLSDHQIAQTAVNEFRQLVERGHGRAARGARLSSPEYEDVTYPSTADIRTELAGRDLACWCPLIDSDGRPVPCHADVLLEIANEETYTDAR